MDKDDKISIFDDIDKLEELYLLLKQRLLDDEVLEDFDPNGEISIYLGFDILSPNMYYHATNGIRMLISEAASRIITNLK